MSFRSFALSDFWKAYDALPESIRKLADKKYELFERDPSIHRSAYSKKERSGPWISAVHIAPSAYREGNEFHWSWIGSHEAYNKLLRRVK